MFLFNLKSIVLIAPTENNLPYLLLAQCGGGFAHRPDIGAILERRFFNENIMIPLETGLLQ
jgi:hypothetical protein